ncbi:signal peptidase [Halohasta litchfieldiae]|jgi:signal peptidase|uniref:Signal peptidase, endoplasmic reticulum-type n=1 Tax=Halohasta litchfieldiae TaxID=1073996 RepID=A0A1H6QTY3_9EURY|nr:S26 family signal peptidase [Halohasta litchfieldiae]ATW88675.1 signal peptidase [Halohasta litchfieldiae]SEI47069.1 signal peptidase, endoplasmic reticulum-type [Halohasta litchfieldiae]
MSPGDRRSPGDEDSGESAQDSSGKPAQESNEGSTQESSAEIDDRSAENGRAESTDHLRDDDQRVTDEQQATGNFQSHTASQESESLWRRFRTARDGPLLLLREVLISGGIVLLIGLVLFGISGVWPPMVAVESESMEPNINQYDLIVVSEPGRFAAEEADRKGVVTAASVSDGEHESFNQPGSVVVYDDPSSFGPPIIHRAHFYVEDNENWYDRANPAYVSADNCAELTHCPAPHAGYITKGDNNASNSQYDQANGIAPVVRPEWVTGIAQVRLPHVGYIRLALTGAASFGPLFPAGISAVGASTAYAIGRRQIWEN